tara:strand:- start:1497 stop:2657 length:1161 start_codon:yes stop_codon:yes gene_type:complete
MPIRNKSFSLTSNSEGRTTYTRNSIPVRVVDVILDSTHPEYEKYGRTNSIGAVKYSIVDREIDVSDPSTLPVAFPISSNIRFLPLKNEVVLLTDGPTVESSNSLSTDSHKYYTTVVSVWNHPNHNSSVDGGSKAKIDFGSDFEEKTDVNPMQPFPGDILIEGRLGQSIRLSGTNSNTNTFSDNSNNGDPFTIISNGQRVVENGDMHIVEDINKDPSSIYLTSNHIIPLVPANNKADANKGDTLIQADAYKGSQVLINGNRLFFNAREESIILSAKKTIALTSKNISLDGKDSIGLDADKIYLGKEALRKERQPVIKGDALEGLLSDLLVLIRNIGLQMQLATSLSGGPVLNLNTEGPTIIKEAQRLLTLINPGGPSSIKSKKVFTE